MRYIVLGVQTLLSMNAYLEQVQQEMMVYEMNKMHR